MDGTASCEEAVLSYLTAIEQQKDLNAYIHVYGEEALARARELDRQRRSGKPMARLHGVVIGLKDVIAYKDHPLTAASRILGGYTSLYNATVVDRMLAEEAILIGHLNCDEFAMGSSNENSAYGNVLNARDKSRVPGGSSGGSAVAVQAGLCMLSLGSDTGGSIRQPADFCGIIGLKPTYGRVSRYGLIAYASSFDQIGIFGRSVRDVALLLEVIAGEDEYDSTIKRQAPPVWKDAPSQKYRIAYFKEALDHPGLDPEIRETILQRTEEWREAGHTVEAIDFELLDYIVPAYYVLTTAEASSNLARFDGVRYGYRTGDRQLELTEFYKRTRSEGFGREVKRRILLGTFVLSAGFYDAYFTKAQQVRRLLVERTNLIFKDFDVIILPTAPSTAWHTGEKMDDPISMYLADIYTVYANLTGIPGISLPLFGHTNGMPFGVQAMTSRFNELYLLQFSHQMMQQ
ncbi:MAG TPA: Asp-tRNA(Asn)/Glu-tRNA(Gln) amidotransferase subunit GatA [Puia sp.]|uniref:Asp-tRNA(Asn)/Glu-tRNA(Gln) amidotransferase subunit GatA n=1 Tax=Puia sp. TaxID=2045100 RepID=UPI002CE43FDB|nr:Asp-tRNA(Asn)/Glu-tRNA(Gln) amidotransferase subunit GatA [Puia sp.]HVU99175.1 Asp-tRNA(Asn)/Glu-tRNA(Gln) amidotransferase subunit GatA [Puia sp.]